MTDVAPITTAAALWTMLLERGGMTGGRSPRRGAYDADLIAEIRNQLFPNTSEPMESLFAKTDVSAEQLLRAFFAAARPFADMKIDILVMLSEAGASRSGDGLQILFNLDPQNDPLDILLKEFSSQMESFAKIIGAFSLWHPSAVEIRNLTTAGGVEYPQSRDPIPSSASPAMRKWLDDRVADEPFGVLPHDWRTGRPDLDSRLERVVNLANNIVFALREYFSNWDELNKVRAVERFGKKVDEKTQLPMYDLMEIGHDHWLTAIARWLINRKEDILHNRNTLVDNVIADIDRILPAQDHKQVERMIRQTIDILDLPVWRNRHEVYAVWLGAQIYHALRNTSWKFAFHIEDNRLEFAFRGVHLATLTHPHYVSPLFWWTELATAVSAPPSCIRKKAIKPDYRIRSSVDAKDLLVVEAKQHLRSTTREFSGALIDYAFACQHGVVLLANHGPVSSAVMDHVTDELRPRCFAFQGVHPGRPKEAFDFRSIISNGLLAALKGQPERAVPGAVVMLSWGESPKDLDLHIHRTGGKKEHIYFESLESAVARLVCDERNGHGPEVAFLEPGIGEFQIVVKQYSSDGELVNSNASVKLVLGQGMRRKEHTFMCACNNDGTSELGRTWYVCFVDTKKFTITPLEFLN